jgi:hypothetical protein
LSILPWRKEMGSQIVSPKYLAALTPIADPAKTGQNELIAVGTAKSSVVQASGR